MNVPLDIKNTLKEINDFNSKLLRASHALTDIEDVDVGTAEKELVFSEDKVRLFRYRRQGAPTCKTPVLAVYALVNRYYMLDLQPDRSFIRKLLEKGIDVYIIDWGYPTQADRYLTLDDYINEYLNDCVDHVRKTTGHDKINLMGICQGGTFCAIYSAINPDKVKNLVTLVTPVDFATNDGLLFSWSKNLNIDALVDNYGVISGDLLNSSFLMLMPFTLNITKYMGMLDVVQDKEKLLNFIRMEKWIFDSPGQAGECLRQFVKDLYQGNKLVKGGLEIGGKKVDLKKITMPLLNIYAVADHIVPPCSTKPLNDLVGSTDKELYEFKGGHIGVFVGGKSQEELAPAVAAWLTKRSEERT
jgi:polyhydroxyalkanoate synthase